MKLSRLVLYFTSVSRIIYISSHVIFSLFQSISLAIQRSKKIVPKVTLPNMGKIFISFVEIKSKTGALHFLKVVFTHLNIWDGLSVFPEITET